MSPSLLRKLFKHLQKCLSTLHSGNRWRTPPQLNNRGNGTSIVKWQKLRIQDLGRSFFNHSLTDRISFVSFSGLEARELLGALPLTKKQSKFSGWEDMIGLL